MALVTVRELYDTKTRPSLVKQGLVRLGAEKVRPGAPALGEARAPPAHPHRPTRAPPAARPPAQYFNEGQIDLVASLTTVQALMDKGAELQGLAVPYLKKTTSSDGRKELATLANDNIIKPTVDVAAERVQPYVEQVRERVAPLVAVVERKRSELVESERFQRALESLKHARAHPIEAAHELKSKAIDLIKYDDLVSYREYVLSPEFQADTLKLLRDDLPVIAREAARRGLELLHTSAVALGEELQAKRAMLLEQWKRGFSEGRQVELDQLRASAVQLVAELKAKLLHTAHAVRAPDLNVHEAIARLTKIFGLEALFGGGVAAPAEAGTAGPAADEPAEASE